MEPNSGIKTHCDEYAAAILNAAGDDIDMAFSILITAAREQQESVKFLAATAREIAKFAAVSK